MACVRPILECASTCWSPSSQKLTHLIEMVQHKAAMFVTNTYPKKGKYEDFSATKLVNSLEWDTLEERRYQSKLSMVYKILNNKVIISSEYLPRVNITRPTRKCNEAKVGAINQLFEPLCKLQTTAKTFFFSAPRLWNNHITPAQAAAPSIDSFKKHFLRG